MAVERRGRGEGDAIQTELLLGCDAVVMGRRTYEGFAPVWPTRSGDPLSDRINSTPKYVVSSTLSEPEWNNTTVISGDPVPELRTPKEASGQDIVRYGFGRLSHTLMQHGLLDERLWVHPLFVGGAQPEDLLQALPCGHVRPHRQQGAEERHRDADLRARRGRLLVTGERESDSFKTARRGR
jgi:dihydrofolate reductase